jgi:hypothetical protein
MVIKIFHLDSRLREEEKKDSDTNLEVSTVKV